MDWTVMQWLEAGGYVVAIIGGLAGATVFVNNKLKRFAAFKYPAVGEAGRNILNPEHSTVLQHERVALSAVVPEEATLLVVLSAEPSPLDARAGIADGIGPGSGAAWGYSIAPAPLNWRGRSYEKESGPTGPRQNFVARSGASELELFFDRLGEVVITVYERGTQVPTWTKTIQVLPRPATM